MRRAHGAITMAQGKATNQALIQAVIQRRRKSAGNPTVTAVLTPVMINTMKNVRMKAKTMGK